MDPKAFIKQRQVLFLKVHKKGLAALGDFDKLVNLGFDHVMDILDSCVVLHELDMPEIEIKYQCSCYEFWHYYNAVTPSPCPSRRKGSRYRASTRSRTSARRGSEGALPRPAVARRLAQRERRKSRRPRVCPAT